jgi:maltose alpha-D-glucosyltransferase/alpha-amylase
MGELLSLTERDAVRTPMQWSNQAHGGFTAAEEPVRPVVEHGRFGWKRVNVAVQRCDADSLLNRIERFIRLRKECPEIGWGSFRVLRSGEDAVLALRFDWRGSSIITLHNFASRPRTVHFTARELEAERGAPLIDALCQTPAIAPRAGRYRLPIEGYGYRWLRIGAYDSANQRVGTTPL